MNNLQFVSDHLWQSTLVVGGIALVALALRQKRAGVRYALWCAASLKFAIPFAVLSSIGAAIGSRVAVRVLRPGSPALADITSAPFIAAAAHGPTSAAATPSAPWSAAAFMPMALVTIWGVGCALVFAVWAVRWSRAALAVRAALPLHAGREVTILRRLEASLGQRKSMTIRASDATIEPGVFGVVRPVLLWPRSMSDHLTDDQIETILIHELSHVRRGDNLTAIVHSAVQSLCWFHPLVWWVGAKLVDERERACDEDVVRMGRDRRVYAESLLKTCQFCVGAPVTCMAGVTGSDLKRRVASIMAAPVGTRLGTIARIALVTASLAVVAVPVVSGAASVPQLTGTGLGLPDPTHTFDAASVRQNKSGDRNRESHNGNGRVSVRNMPLKTLVLQAFSLQDSQIVGGPGWLTTDLFDIVAKADTSTSSAELKVMMQNLLIERFGMKVHVETRNLPIYALVVARTDRQLGPDIHVAKCETYTTGQGCGSGASASASAGGPAGRGGMSSMSSTTAGDGGGGGGGGISVSAGRGASAGVGANMMMTGTTMPGFAQMLAGIVGRTVVDRTGLDGRFELKFRYSMPNSGGNGDDSAQKAPDLFTALQEQLGLKLEATRGPVEVLVIDSAEHPVNDDFVMPDSQ